MRSVILAAFLVGIGPGCGSLGGHLSYPDDPLLLSRKPVEGKADAPEQLLLVLGEPALPRLPAEAYVIAPTSTKRNRVRMPVAAMPVSRRKVPGLYGHAPDHSWLQGVVNQTAPGSYELYYSESAADDALGGKACLAEDPRLASLRTGDVISVEGDIAHEQDGFAQRAGQSCPSYRIREMWLIQRGD